MRTFLLTLLLLIAPLQGSYAQSINNKTFGIWEVQKVTSIYDGDTFRVNINDVHPIIGHRIPIRIKNIDTPELRGECAKEKTLAKQAKQFTVNALRSAQSIQLHNISRGKYFRVIADVIVDGANLGNMLIKAGLAVPYQGQHKTNWCI